MILGSERGVIGAVTASTGTIGTGDIFEVTRTFVAGRYICLSLQLGDIP